MGQMAGLAGSYTQARLAAEPDKPQANQFAQMQAKPMPGIASMPKPQMPIIGGVPGGARPTPQRADYGPNAVATPVQNHGGQGVRGLGNTFSRLADELPQTTPDQGGVVAGYQGNQNAVDYARQQGPSLADIQAEMNRRQIGAQLNQNPDNSALAGYMMS